MLQVIQLTDDLLKDAQQQQEPAVPAPRPRCKAVHQERAFSPDQMLASLCTCACFHRQLQPLLCFRQRILPAHHPQPFDCFSFGFAVSRFDRDEPAPRASATAPEPSTNAVITAPSLQLPSILPPQVAEQIRSAQQRAALQNQAPAAWAIGARCQAVFSGDGEWYNASVSGVTTSDNFLITFAEYGNQEEVHRSNVRPRPDGSEVYRGVSAPKRKAVNDAPAQLEEMPKVSSQELT